MKAERIPIVRDIMNFVAKHAHKFNKPQVYRDKKKEYKRKPKHPEF